MGYAVDPDKDHVKERLQCLNICFDVFLDKIENSLKKLPEKDGGQSAEAKIEKGSLDGNYVQKGSIHRAQPRDLEKVTKDLEQRIDELKNYVQSRHRNICIIAERKLLFKKVLEEFMKELEDGFAKKIIDKVQSHESETMEALQGDYKKAYSRCAL